MTMKIMLGLYVHFQKLGEAFGPQWAAKDLLPRLLEKYHGTQATIVASPTSGRIPGFGTSVDVAENERDVGVSYLIRLTVLHCIPVRN